MTTATLATGNRMTEAAVRPRRSLEELVDRLMDALFAANTVGEKPRATRTIHEARRLGQAGDVDGALAVLAGIDAGKAAPGEARWAFSEWNGLVRWRFGDRDPVVYSQGTGMGAALVPHGEGTLEVVSVLGMRWWPSKVVSIRSLRWLRPLEKTCP